MTPAEFLNDPLDLFTSHLYNGPDADEPCRAYTLIAGR